MEPVSIRRAVSDIIREMVPQGAYLSKFEELDRRGRFDTPTLIKLLALILNRLEALEATDQ